MRNELLCKLVDKDLCPVVPDSSRGSVHVILSDLHNSALAGHLGFGKLLKAVSLRFYCRGIPASMKAFVRNCAICQSNKHSTQHPTGLLQPLENPTRLFGHVTIDFVTHLPLSTRIYDAIFSIIDRFACLGIFIPYYSSIFALDCA